MKIVNDKMKIIYIILILINYIYIYIYLWAFHQDIRKKMVYQRKKEFGRIMGGQEKRIKRIQNVFV